MLTLDSYRARNGQELLYSGQPDFGLLESVVEGPGDLWHSGPDRGTRDLLPQILYWSGNSYWYKRDFKSAQGGISWRVDPTGFVIRKSVWTDLGGLDNGYTSAVGSAIDLGFRCLQRGGIPLQVPGLYAGQDRAQHLPVTDLYLFFLRHFKADHARFLLARESVKYLRPWRELAAHRCAQQILRRVPPPRMAEAIPARALLPLTGTPRVSVIIPTMRRQEYTCQLLEDYGQQTLPPHEILVVDATPVAERNPALYEAFTPRLPLRVIWQTSLGSCRARNEAIRLCTGDFVLFGDDDTRIPPDFVENHVRVLETYRAQGANGLDLRADHYQQGQADLAAKRAQRTVETGRVGASHICNNANNCVRKEWVDKVIGNDVNFDGGYGEDTDFGYCLVEQGAVILFNPFSVNLHLKPPAGGFRWWGSQAGKTGKARRRQPWEVKRRVRWLTPRPSPTIMYGFMKHCDAEQMRDWRFNYVCRYLFPDFGKDSGRTLWGFPLRLLYLPILLLKIRLSQRFATDLIALGPRYE